MAMDIIMPQMGESVAEGTIVRWLKKVGDAVERDEPIFEITTDKVDAEIPSPEAGVILEIRVVAGTTVEVGAVVGRLGAAGEAAASAPAPSAPSQRPLRAPRRGPRGCPGPSSAPRRPPPRARRRQAPRRDDGRRASADAQHARRARHRRRARPRPAQTSPARAWTGA
jgi:pyruvate dehydrogenase E2 component (dihydrolipoamide acetyltransferase)